jgi:hypothetical protein
MSVNAYPARSTGAPEGPALLARLRDRLLDQVLGLLEADPAVAGVALVGSLGRGEEDRLRPHRLQVRRPPSPRACEMIRFLDQRRDFNDRDPAAQILALRGIAKDLTSPSWGQLGDAVASYLDLVEATV